MHCAGGKQADVETDVATAVATDVATADYSRR